MCAKLIIFLISILLTGCSWINPAPTPPVARIGLQLSPATLGTSISVQQHLIVEHQDHTDQLDTALEINPHQLTLVGLALDQRVMTISYDGKTLQIWRHPLLPKQVQAKDVLEDMQLTLWPLPAIRAALPAGWTITQKNKQRILFLHHAPIMIINYSNKIRWQGTVVLTNLYYHYRLTIQSVNAK